MTYNHCPTGWAVAFTSPYRMFKRYSQYADGTADPLIIHWPNGSSARAEVRQQYHHCTGVVPPSRSCGLTMPMWWMGAAGAVGGVSMRYSFAPLRPPRRERSTPRCSAPVVCGTTAGRCQPNTVT